MRSIIFASLVALALAATPAFERTFEPKTDYHYKFDGLVLSGLPTASSESSQSRISCRARLQSVDDRHIHLQLINIRMSASHMPETEQMPALNALEQREVPEEYKMLLELPVRAQLRNGLVSEIQFDKEDAEWSKNVKRAVLNMISFNPTMPTEEIESRLNENIADEENQSFFTNEKTIEGDCQVAYTIVREQKKTIITKSINFDKCIMRPETNYGLRYSTECPECGNDAQVMRPQTVYTYVLEKNLLKEAEVRSLYTVNFNGQEVMKTETRSKLAYEESHNLKGEIKKVHGEKEEIIYSSRWEQLVEDFFKNGDKAEIMPFEKFPIDKKIQLIREVTEQIQEFENNMPETAHQVARLVRLFRTCTLEQIHKIHQAVYTKADQKIKNIIDHSLAVAGTKNTIQHLINHIEKKEITSLTAAHLIKSMHETPYPSEQIADLLIQLAQSRAAKSDETVRQSAWLAAGSVVRGVVSNANEIHLIRENKREIKQKYVNVFLQQFREAESTYESILALKALGNAGIDVSVNELNEIIVDNKQPLIIRKEAIDALRLLRDTMPRKIQRVLLPVYKNRQFAPELRMAALWRLMQTRPEEALLAQVVYQMEKESNQQVAAFTYQLIRHYAKSTNPCYQRVASECSRLISFTRYQPQEDLLSTYAQLPIFSQDTLSGAQFDFAAIFEKNSFLPKDLHASLDAVFGGNWNKYIASLGFSQQNFNRIIRKTLSKLNDFSGSAEQTVVRGRRTQTPASNLVQQIANALKISARQPANEESEAYAMTFLRYKDMDYIVLPIDSAMIEKLVSRFIKNGAISTKEINQLFNQKSEFEEHHAAFFYETIRKVPTTLGLPLTITGKIPTVFSVEGQVTLETEGSQLSFNLEVRPSVAATHVFEMRIFTPLFEQGIKTLQSLRAFTPIKMEALVAFGKTMEVTYKIVVPENQKSIVSVSTRPVVLLRFPGYTSRFQYVEAEERTVVVPQWQQKTQELEQVYKYYGLEFAARGNVLNQWNVENWLLAEQDVEFTIENKNRPAEFKAMLTLGALEKKSLSQINFNNVFENEFELEESATEQRREHFQKMIQEIKKQSEGKQQRSTLKLQGPEGVYMNTEVVTLCDRQVRLCNWNIDVERSPLMSENKDWTLRANLLAARPQMPSSLRQLREQPHREIQLAMNAKWGSSKKSEMQVNAQLQQSKEQKMVERSLSRSFNGLPEYELLLKASRLNQFDAVAEYKLTEGTEQTISRLFDLVKAYNYWTVSTQQQENNEENRVAMRFTVEPITRQYVNFTVQTPEQRVEMKNVQTPQLYLPSIAQRTMRQQLTENTGAICKVDKNQIRTFDNLFYTAPMTSCKSVIVKDCSEQPTFAVTVQESKRNSENLIAEITRQNEVVALQMVDDEIVVKVDGSEIQSEELENYDIQRIGSRVVLVRLPEGEVRFDGYTIKTYMSRFMLNNQLCGLCGNNDDDMSNEFQTADNMETENIQKFHHDFILKNEQCSSDDERLSEKKNYRKYERDQDDSSYESDEENDYTTERQTKSSLKSNNKNLVEKTQIKEFSHRVCFSVEPVPECRRGFEEEKTAQKKIRFTCLPRHNQEARRLLKEARDQVLSLEDYPVSYVKPVDVPTTCVAY